MQFTELSQRLLRSYQTNVDELLSEVEHSLALNRSILQQLEESWVPELSGQDWERIQAQVSKPALSSAVGLCAGGDLGQKDLKGQIGPP